MIAPTRPVVLVRAGARVCALAVADVVETMRPLPVAPLAGAPTFVAGAAIARGEATPVVNLDALLSGAPASETPPPARFVLVRAGGRHALLAVDAVLGVTALAGGADAPPLLAAAASGAVEALGARDGELLVVLRSARLVPDAAADGGRA
jgi:purine-binding chemotaxis protein CheW